MMRRFPELIQATRPYTEEEIVKSWRLFITTIFVWGISLYLTIPEFPLPVRILASIFSGLVSVRLFIFYHDYLHGAIFRHSTAARGILWVFGILILNPKNVWKRSHDYHHQHNAQMATASIGSFPVMTTEQYAKASSKEKFLYYLARHPLTILLGYVTIFILGMCVKSFLTDPRRHWDSLLALVVHVALIVYLSFFGWDVVFLSLQLPLIVASALGSYLFYIQHNFPDVKMKPREEWEYGFAAIQSSSFMDGNPLVHWLTGNIGYHHVHHLNARIPFYRLPEVMAAIPELQNPGKTSLAVWDIYQALRLKLWDAKSGKMVGFIHESDSSVSAHGPTESPVSPA
jgi:omega-6 fatty acid desaturase (delta-12 desaturase)